MTQDAMTLEQVRIAIEAGWRMRVGRSLGRTIYLYSPEFHDPLTGGGLCVGIVDSTDLAREMRDRWNAVADALADLRAQIVALEPGAPNTGYLQGWDAAIVAVLGLFDGGGS